MRILTREVALAIMLLLATSTGYIRSITGESGVTTVTFHVQDYMTAQSIQGAVISMSGLQSISQTTNSAGNVTMVIPFGTYLITITAPPCTTIEPQTFITDETAPSSITVKLRCPQSLSPPLVNPVVQTDKSQYRHKEAVTWHSSGFAPGAYVQPCLSALCGGIIQSDGFGNASGVLLVESLVPLAQATLSVRDVNTNAIAQIAVTILM